jgi:poly(A) polymerase
VILEQPNDKSFVSIALARTDERIRADKPISPGFLFATLLWQPVAERWRRAVERGEHTIPALADAIDSVIADQGDQLAITRRYQADMREIWMMQPRFERRIGRSPWNLVEHIRFRAGYDFLLLRCDSGEVPQELGQWWTEFQEADSQEREALIAEAKNRSGESGPRKRRKRSSSGRKKPLSNIETSAHAADLEAGMAGGAGATSRPHSGPGNGRPA